MDYEKLWHDLDLYLDILEENLAGELLNKESAGCERKNESEEKIQNISEFREKQKEILDRFIFWELCSRMKDGYLISDILLNKKITVKTDKIFENQFIDDIRNTKYRKNDKIDELTELRLLDKRILEIENIFTGKLSKSLIREYNEIVSEYIDWAVMLSTERYVHGFQNAIRMFIGAYLEYNSWISIFLFYKLIINSSEASVKILR